MTEVYHRDCPLGTIPDFKIPVCFLLENFRSAFNVGSVFRTADAFRIEKIYLSGYTAAPPNPKLKKTALGAEDFVSWEQPLNTIDLLTHLRQQQYTIYAMERGDRSLNISSVCIKYPAVFIFGNEVTGISQELLRLADIIMEIPMSGYKNSLNVATAAGIVAFQSSTIWRHTFVPPPKEHSLSIMH